MSDLVPTGRELEALKVLWAKGKASVREVYGALAPKDGALAYTTVLSLLQTMEQKGLVGHEAAGRAYLYYAKVPSDGVFRRLAGGFLDQVFDGALGEYVSRALQAKSPSFAELEDLERMIVQAKEARRLEEDAPKTKGGKR